MTVSDTRTSGTDTSGALLVELLESAGHRVAGREIVPDEVDAIAAAIEKWDADDEVEVVVLTGGTGISRRDVTTEAATLLFAREIPGFAELFRHLSYEEIGTRAILSRAIAGVTKNGTLVAALPGSRGGCRTAMERILLPEMSHLIGEIRKEMKG